MALFLICQGKGLLIDSGDNFLYFSFKIRTFDDIAYSKSGKRRGADMVPT